MAYRVTTSKRILASPLTRAVKGQVAALQGIDVSFGQVVFHRLTGEFSDDEQRLIDAEVATHDAEAIERITATRKAQEAAERAKRPSTMTLIERMERLEIVLGLD